MEDKGFFVLDPLDISFLESILIIWWIKVPISDIYNNNEYTITNLNTQTQ